MFVLCLATALALVGCAAETAREPLPTYRLMSPEESIQIIAARQAEIKKVSARSEIELTDADGQQVNLDGALPAMPQTTTGPRVRLRAWKLGHAVFDLTVVDGKAWIVAPDDPRLGEPARKSSPSESETGDARRTPAQPARRIAEAIDFIGPDFFKASSVVRESAVSITAEVLRRG